MNRLFCSLIAGIIFGLGLALSGMINPIKVLDFLDFTGNWDPSLAFVMMGALIVSFFAFRLIPKRLSPVFDNKFRIPTRSDIDIRLCFGATLFGIGWGLSGYCPGPAISSLGIGANDVFIFVLSMLAGFSVHRFIPEKK